MKQLARFVLPKEHIFRLFACSDGSRPSERSLRQSLAFAERRLLLQTVIPQKLFDRIVDAHEGFTRRDVAAASEEFGGD